MQITLATPLRAPYFDGITTIEFTRFPNGHLALLADGAKLSKAIPDLTLAPDEAAIPDYNQFAGMPAALVRTGAFEFTDKVIENGYVTLPIVRVIHPAFNAAQV